MPLTDPPTPHERTKELNICSHCRCETMLTKQAVSSLNCLYIFAKNYTYYKTRVSAIKTKFFSAGTAKNQFRIKRTSKPSWLCMHITNLSHQILRCFFLGGGERDLLNIRDTTSIQIMKLKQR